MSTQPTVLLTSGDSQLIDSLRRDRPDVMVMTIDSAIPPEKFPGPVTAFVDWLLPDTSGLELCRRLREAENTRHARVTMILESKEPDARRRALQAGADDYLLGPLNLEALLQRISAKEVWPRPGVGPRLSYGELIIDLASYQVRYQNRRVPMRPLEFRLLVHFVEHQDEVFSRSSLIELLGKSVDEIEEATVNSYVARLRAILRTAGAPYSLRTVKNVGYVLDSLRPSAPQSNLAMETRHS